MSSEKNVNHSFWTFVIAIFIILIVPALIQDGMFTDGLLYACVARNLANGLGTFWFPHFSNTAMPSFHEQPPLFFAIEGLFFKLFGDSIYSERFCSFIMACLTAFFINKIWKQIYNTDQEIKQMGWLPVFFWIIIPVCFWAYVNNVEETMMGFFVIVSVYFIVKGLNTNSKSVYFFIAGLTIFLASLCKGFQGLFPMVVIGFYWITYRNISFIKVFLYSLILLGVPLTIYSFLLMNDSIYQSFSNYFQTRIIGTFNNVGITTDNRFELLWRLLTELIPVFAVCFIIFLIAKFKKTDFSKVKSDYKMALFFILIGVSGSFPLIITLEQRGFYLVTSFPYFAIGISIIIAPLLSRLLNNINMQAPLFKVFRNFSILFLCVSIILSLSMIGKTKRDEDILHDIYMIGKIVPEKSTISIDLALWNEWALQGYFVRHFNISLDPSNQQKYFLIEKEKNNSLMADYNKLEIQTVKYNLYQKISQ